MFKRFPKEEERRRYIRLDSVFPVEFLLQDKEGNKLTDWLQGFTSNVGKGGICLNINNPSKEFLKILERKDLDFILKIEIPLYHKPVEAKSKLAWYEI
ncbi:MAG: hypothetical protein NC900_05965, partial [Candidatus Omnitrophica bacterium]|nr:hypothetical protein [Candidatus Omnitrophota bacterium]